MIRTTLIPDTADISIHLPNNYVGRKIEVLLYAVDELSEAGTTIKKIDNSGLRGSLNLSENEYKDFQQYAKNIRNEWEKDI